MTSLPGFGIAMIGDRINPGFKSTKGCCWTMRTLLEFGAAIRQVDAGASALDVTIGPRESTDLVFLASGRARHPGRRTGAVVLRFPGRSRAGSLP